MLFRSVEKGEFVSIMGPSGCGKSTLLNIIGLLSTPTTGSVKILGTDCNKMADTELAHFRNKNLGFVFQSFHLIPSLSVAANVELPLGYRSGLSASQRRELARAIPEEKQGGMPRNRQAGAVGCRPERGSIITLFTTFLHTNPKCHQKVKY